MEKKIEFTVFTNLTCPKEYLLYQVDKIDLIFHPEKYKALLRDQTGIRKNTDQICAITKNLMTSCVFSKKYGKRLPGLNHY